MKTNKYLLAFVLTCGMMTSCDGLLDIDAPTDSMTPSQIFESEETIEIALTGLYTTNFLDNAMYYQTLELNLGLVSDELKFRRNDLKEYHENNYTPASSYFDRHWTEPYETIYQANDFIIHVGNSKVLSDEKKRSVLSEALFFRAYSYFMLVNSFGDVPLVLTNNYKESAKMPRTPKDQVYKQIIEDLEEAQEGLLTSSNGTTRITSEAAKALLARTYLYTGQWEKAKNKASELIPAEHGGSGTKFKLEEFDKIFKASSVESILQINMMGYAGSGTYNGYTRIGSMFIPRGSNSNYDLSEQIVNAMQEDPKDLRKSWIGSKSKGSVVFYYPYKYKNNKTPENVDDAEFMVLLRLAEQYMIRCEANAHLGDMEAALKDLNVIRARAGVDPIESVGSAEELLLLIEQERRKEFFFECGHRWFDLNRTGRADAVYSKIDYKTFWKPYKALLPIPEEQIGRNTALEQNPGY